MDGEETVAMGTGHLRMRADGFRGSHNRGPVTKKEKLQALISLPSRAKALDVSLDLPDAFGREPVAFPGGLEAIVA
jgi:hypothetical protein